jgi:radical SAM protein with 4Fe4S-binding SPASM domain
VLTVGNHADGPYTYLKRLAENPSRAEEALTLLRRNGGNRSGEGIASVAWDGAVHPDQFWRSRVVGNIRETPLSELWTRPAADSLLDQLRRRKPLLQCRCRECRFLDVCNGNLRVRAEAAGNGLWGDDPACYLTDEEIREVSR